MNSFRDGFCDFFCCHFNGGRLQWWETEKPIWFLFSLQVYFWWCFGAQIAPQPPQIGKHLQVDLPWLCTVRAGHPFFQLANSASIFQKFLRSSASQALWFFSLSRKKKKRSVFSPLSNFWFGAHVLIHPLSACGFFRGNSGQKSHHDCRCPSSP